MPLPDDPIIQVGPYMRRLYAQSQSGEWPRMGFEPMRAGVFMMHSSASPIYASTFVRMLSHISVNAACVMWPWIDCLGFS